VRITDGNSPSSRSLMKRSAFVLVTIVIAALLAGCASRQSEGLGAYKFKITTKSREAQQAFDRGLTWAYAFAYKAAEDEFRAAAAGRRG
jgi:hypothetical protein